MTEILSYDIQGKGPGLVLLHGTSSTGLGSWGTVLEGLAAKYTVVLPNLPGSGDSPLPDGPLDVDTVADQIVATARKAGLETFALAGASLGAPIAIKVAARHPERISQLATVVGFARPRPTLRMNLDLWAAMFDRQDKDLGKLLVMLSFSDEFLAALPEEQLPQVMAMMTAHPAPGTAAQIDFGLRLDVRPDLGKIQAPTLVVSAAGDRFIPPAHSREIAAGIPGARLVEVAGGHASIFEDPQETLSALLDFLNG
ncbi:pimeloyl-ACP methyl ester carboxylesterase [Micromonospora pisi]|uniref:Pimeloyl-ACP methyl ester carboxylesterase n=1 Tax=Micromonospora pisi TaxID=589240 RepID=A0A495JDM4_9ACTN|nr:alpha/beta fold hydrolase [Micromonospora pisi]RKR86618.1 pimeloyl-ACP methyl ester carboxylesterase [Micromonospora pisi]